MTAKILDQRRKTRHDNLQGFFGAVGKFAATAAQAEGLQLPHDRSIGDLREGCKTTWHQWDHNLSSGDKRIIRSQSRTAAQRHSGRGGWGVLLFSVRTGQIPTSFAEILPALCRHEICAALPSSKVPRALRGTCRFYRSLAWEMGTILSVRRQRYFICKTGVNLSVMHS